jgi:hypothetical protein
VRIDEADTQRGEFSHNDSRLVALRFGMSWVTQDFWSPGSAYPVSGISGPPGSSSGRSWST